eukprot:11588961-Alexandrium_andersonii.AAC.1
MSRAFRAFGAAKSGLQRCGPDPAVDAAAYLSRSGPSELCRLGPAAFCRSGRSQCLVRPAALRRICLLYTSPSPRD